MQGHSFDESTFGRTRHEPRLLSSASTHCSRTSCVHFWAACSLNCQRHWSDRCGAHVCMGAPFTDLGYNELGFMNSTRGIHTPHLDALANAGVILNNYCECAQSGIWQTLAFRGHTFLAARRVSPLPGNAGYCMQTTAGHCCTTSVATSGQC